MISKNHIIILFATISLTYSCQDLDDNNRFAEKEMILILLDQQKQYHFKEMAEELVSQLSTNYIDINKGEIKTPTREESISGFKNYFNSVEFEKWDDINPPIIRFSDENTMAYAIINKEVVLKYKDEEDQLIRLSIEYSWVAIYSKWHDGWKIDCIASTNKPGVKNKINNVVYSK